MQRYGEASGAVQGGDFVFLSFIAIMDGTMSTLGDVEHTLGHVNDMLGCVKVMLSTH